MASRATSQDPKPDRKIKLCDVLYHKQVSDSEVDTTQRNQIDKAAAASYSALEEQYVTSTLPLNTDDGHVRLFTEQVLPNTAFSLKESWKYDSIVLDIADIQRWAMASQVLKSKPFFLGREYFQDFKSDAIIDFAASDWTFDPSVCDYAHNFPGHDLYQRYRDQNHLYLLPFLFLFTVIYGGVHISAWNAHFPTTFEKLLWRSSSIIAVASGPAFSVTPFTLMLLFQNIEEIIDRDIEGPPSQLSHLLHFLAIHIGIFIICVGYLAVVVTRVYLVIEPFVSLRKLPVAAYDTPRWVQDIPHL